MDSRRKMRAMRWNERIRVSVRFFNITSIAMFGLAVIQPIPSFVPWSGSRQRPVETRSWVSRRLVKISLESTLSNGRQRGCGVVSGRLQAMPAGIGSG